MTMKTKWQKAYDKYLRSPEWRSKKADVLRRDGYICQSCGQNPATEVHHVTYRYGRYTPLWLLRSVCRDCHEKLTAIDGGRLNPWAKAWIGAYEQWHEENENGR